MLYCVLVRFQEPNPTIYR